MKMKNMKIDEWIQINDDPHFLDDNKWKDKRISMSAEEFDKIVHDVFQKNLALPQIQGLLEILANQ
jgi:hypothetical protein